MYDCIYNDENDANIFLNQIKNNKIGLCYKSMERIFEVFAVFFLFWFLNIARIHVSEISQFHI